MSYETLSFNLKKTAKATVIFCFAISLELAVTTITDGTTTLTQGFHQPVLDIKLNAKVLLQGAAVNPFSGEESLMRDNLRVAGSIPTTSPYSDAVTCDASVFTVTGNDAIVDWVWIELRDDVDTSIIISSRSALLQRDGDVVDINGVSNLGFAVNSKEYHVVLRHRNHLGIISASPILLSLGSTANLDFTTSSTTANGGVNALTDLGDGRYAIYAGDQTGNGQIQNSDITGVAFSLGGSGYDNADIDLNNQIQNSDINSLIYPNLGKGEQF